MELDDLDERTRSSLAAYDANAREWQEAFRMKRPVTEARKFAEYAGRGALIADVGCGPGSDLRLLTDVGLHPIGIDASQGALDFARLLLPRHPLILSPFQDLPFDDDTFDGLWLSSAFTHLPRADWPSVFAHVMSKRRAGPVYFSCYRGTADMEEVQDPILGTIHRSQATEDEVERMLSAHGLLDVRIDVRGDPIVDRRRPWVVALARA
ncbi:MAG TPA: class I SAM-dependent methyltransferase [Nitriliruptoraceae bacterium]|nr:class I SAM-dependent methyltransferase [Nitriliruptoraceae bacterium]